MAAVAVAAGVAATADAPRAQAAPADCPELNVVAVPGTWETSRDEPRQGMLSLVTRGLPRSVRTDYVSYAATALPWEGEVYGLSKREAVSKARDLVAATAARCDRTRFALIGYSQGADAAGDLAAEIGTGLGVVAPDRVVAVGLLSDPRRSPTDPLVGPPVPGIGAGGVRIGGFGWLGPKVRTFCAAGDLYCAVPTDDLAGRFAGFATQLSAPDPLQFGNYAQTLQSILSEALIPGTTAILNAPPDNPASEQWQRQVQEFLESGAHQSYPHYVVDPNGTTATTWLHNWIGDLAAEPR
ncbi:cutinase family protein [Nocardia sp. CDC159]|uniref:Cutinase family protein n=1 Tax=Nocardia pulmonis TaxID=2951408 RepID=A0A9X2E783_9NOCA|nr:MULTISPECIES: cutinase family protein [Nocardia]MCM6775397.1 cutinase family protein [Nocardia pulmonis]MCM6787869.1 cutinase family protein [Nocardia sp. CDC159]